MASRARTAILGAVLAATCSESAVYHGRNSSAIWLPRTPVVLTATGADLVHEDSLPVHFDWRNVNGKSFVAADVNQHIPQYCGACWIHGTVAQLNDRIKVFRGAAFPDVMISRQALVNCVPGEDGTAPGCFGGDSYMIYDHMHKNKVPDESCNPWKAKNEQCTASHICSNCSPPPGFLEAIQAGKDVSTMDMAGGCFAVPEFIAYGVKEYGTINESMAMMKEIYARGPITCAMDADDDFMNNYSQNAEKNEGVYVTATKSTSTDHDIEVAGWGETAGGIKYWVVRNSWGTYWGQGGWFKIQRGVNALKIESECTWAVPEFEQESLAVEGRVFGDYHLGVREVPAGLATGLAGQPSSAGQPLALLLAAALGASGSAVLLLRFQRRDGLHQPHLLG